MRAMNRLTRASRMIALLTLALQVTMPGAAAVADARLEAASERATPHFESHATTACVVLHADNCALCQFLSTAQPLADRQVVSLPDAPREWRRLPKAPFVSPVPALGPRRHVLHPSPKHRTPPVAA